MKPWKCRGHYPAPPHGFSLSWGTQICVPYSIGRATATQFCTYLSSGGVSLQFNGAGGLVYPRYRDFEVVRRKQIGHAVRPFDDTDSGTLQIFLQTKTDDFAVVLQAVEIDVVDWYFPLVLIDEGVGRAVDDLV